MKTKGRRQSTNVQDVRDTGKALYENASPTKGSRPTARGQAEDYIRAVVKNRPQPAPGRRTGAHSKVTNKAEMARASRQGIKKLGKK